jgi:argininosuccinate synthase
MAYAPETSLLGPWPIWALGSLHTSYFASNHLIQLHLQNNCTNLPYHVHANMVGTTINTYCYAWSYEAILTTDLWT